MDTSKIEQTKIVIGVNFGDEGKGLVTDYLSSQMENCCVIRFSSGSQAGHTVVTPEGKRHVFHHVSSGTLAGAATYLSEFFICNPIIFNEELSQLGLMGIEPNIYVHPECEITTPYDMLLNQITEESRGDKKHGSCGLGINETILRGRTYPFCASELNYEGFIINRIKAIKNIYLPAKIKALGIILPEKYASLLESQDLFDNYIEDCFKFRDRIIMTKYPTSLFRNLIFEGSQGLRLDQNSKYFPHVTHAHTGLRNAIQIAKHLSRKELEVYYVTRPYITRHGAGPLPYELHHIPYPKVKDETNITNQWQGSLRFAYLDLDELFQFIYDDLSRNTMNARHAKLVMTCMDQLDGYFYFIDEGVTRYLPKKEFLTDILSKYWSLEKVLFSTGPTREDIKTYEELF